MILTGDLSWKQPSAGVPNTVPGDLPSCKVQLQAWSNTIPANKHIRKHLIIMGELDKGRNSTLQLVDLQEQDWAPLTYSMMLLLHPYSVWDLDCISQKH